MPRFAAVFGVAPSTQTGGAASALEAMLGSPRAGESRTVIAGHGGGVALAVPASPAEALRSGMGAARDESAFCVADATLYHRGDLIAALKGARGLEVGPNLSDTQLILLAYRVWGTDAPSRLEGDFAFAIWDERAERGLAAADFAAGRTLFYGNAGDELAVASTLETLASHPRFDRSLNLAHLGEIAGGFWAGSGDTRLRSAFRLLPGHSLAWDSAGWTTSRHWALGGRTSRSRPETDRLPFGEAAKELRERLIGAVGERMDTAGTAVWLSGGYDSTAVFAAGQEWLRRSGLPADTLRTVSMSYPEGDPGREDELIRAVTGHWGVSSTWVQSDEVPVLREPWLAAGRRDEPWAHPFEGWNRALADAARDSGAATVLTGSGGDQLFASPIGQLSDLFWRGRWGLLRREWLDRRGKGLRLFARFAVLPGLPRGAYRLASVLRGGRRLHHFLDRSPPPWFRDSFLRDHDLLERQWNERAWARPGRAGEAEMAFYFGTAYAPRVTAAVRGFVADAGLQVVAPLLDRRVVDLAAGRPGEERSRGMETKRLLREAMRGLLPESVLAPRAEKTGLTVGYFERAFRQGLGPALRQLDDRDMRLADLGVVEPHVFQRSAARYLASRDPSPGLALYLTLQAEWWLRAKPDIRGG